MLPLGAYVLLCLVFSGNVKAAENEDHLRFPENFLLGVSTAAYQIEGAWNVSDKGESFWDHFTHSPDSLVINKENGDIAANSYYKYKEDIAIIKKMGFKSYRFSLSWTRILPKGTADVVSKTGVEYYHKVIDELLANGIEPTVTILHFDHPQIFEDKGGWLNPEMVDWFAEYARFVFREYGSKVKRFIPINEPHAFCTSTYLLQKTKYHGVGEYQCIHNMLKAHAMAYRIYEIEFKKQYKGQVGILNNISGSLPKSSEEKLTAERFFEFNAGWVLHPVFSEKGDYPDVMKEYVYRKSMEQGYLYSRLPQFDTHWIDFIRGSADFLCLNHYTTRLIEDGKTGLVPSHDDDQETIESADSNWKRAASEWLYVVPGGLRTVLRKLAESYGNPPIYITENGFSDRGTLDDDDRISYFREYLKQMLLAIYEDGVNVKGYFVWSLLDNFEWVVGYSERFGIVHVDFNDPNRTRTLKKSATWWENIIAAGKIDANQTMIIQ